MSGITLYFVFFYYSMIFFTGTRYLTHLFHGEDHRKMVQFEEGFSVFELKIRWNL